MEEYDEDEHVIETESSKDLAIKQLKIVNKKLRNKLSELSSALDNAIQKAMKRMPGKHHHPENIENIIRVKDKELQN